MQVGLLLPCDAAAVRVYGCCVWQLVLCRKLGYEVFCQVLTLLY